MAITINSSVTVPAVVTRSATGTVEFDHEVDGSSTFKSAALGKYPNGTRLLLTFRITGKGQRQLVKTVKVEHTDRFRLVLVDVQAEAHSVVDSFNLARWFQVQLGLENSATEELASRINAADFPIDLGVGLDVSEAYVLKNDLNAKSNNVFVVDVIAHTPDDMPFSTPIHDDNQEYIGNIYVPENLRAIIPTLARIISDKEIVNVMLTGPAGFGKTSMFEAIAQRLDLEFVRFDCSLIQDTQHWFGTARAENGSTFFDKSRFWEVVERGNAVVLLDEANRLEPRLSNSLFPILDHSRRTLIENMELVCGPSIIFGVSMNVGFQYAGTEPVDLAWLRRMQIIEEIGPLPSEKEEEVLRRKFPSLPHNDIRRIVSVCDDLRRVSKSQGLELNVSIATSINLAFLVEKGMPIRRAARVVIETRELEPELRKPIVDALNTRLGILS